MSRVRAAHVRTKRRNEEEEVGGEGAPQVVLDINPSFIPILNVHNLYW